MPEFILQGKESPRFQDLDEFTQGYIEAMFFTNSGPDYEEEGLEGIGFYDLDYDTIVSIKYDCWKFQKNNEKLLDAAVETSAGEYEIEQAGMDFWYTRQGHGVGYWSRGLKGPGEALAKAAKVYKECYVYRGDDGKVYVE